MLRAYKSRITWREAAGISVALLATINTVPALVTPTVALKTSVKAALSCYTSKYQVATDASYKTTRPNDFVRCVVKCEDTIVMSIGITSIDQSTERAWDESFKEVKSLSRYNWQAVSQSVRLGTKSTWPLRMWGARSAETSSTTHSTTQHCITEDRNPQLPTWFASSNIALNVMYKVTQKSVNQLAVQQNIFG